MTDTKSRIDAGKAVIALFETPQPEDAEHVGVKGMRWGVRKSREEREADRAARDQKKENKAITKKALKKGASPEAAEKKALQKQVKKHGLDSLTNEQLGALNKRLNAETQYKQWQQKNPTLAKKAQDFALKEISTHGINSLKTLNGRDEKQMVVGVFREAFAPKPSGYTPGGKRRAEGPAQFMVSDQGYQPTHRYEPPAE